MTPRNGGYADWEVTQLIANAIGLDWKYTHPSQIMDEIAQLTPTFKGVSYAKLDELGSVQWPCNDANPAGSPVMHVTTFANGKGKFVLTEYVPTDERTGARYPLLLTTGRILSQYNVGAQTRRTDNVVWHQEDRLEINPHDAEQRGIKDGQWVRIASRAGETALRALVTDRVARWGRLHDVPPSADTGQRNHHRLLRLGDQLSRIQGDRRASEPGNRTDAVPAGVRGVRDEEPRGRARRHRSRRHDADREARHDGESDRGRSSPRRARSARSRRSPATSRSSGTRA